MKKLIVLGSTGSIGVNTLNVVRDFPNLFEITALSAHSSVDKLAAQANEFKPGALIIHDAGKIPELKSKLKFDCEILSGPEGLLEAAKRGNYDIFVNALVGFAGLAPTIEGIKLKKRIALANKETLVAAGELVISLCAKYGSELLPIDSEHSAIFQCLVGEKREHLNKIILTASGGPFLNCDEAMLKKATIKEALNHPNWKMGNKITIDSATLMNKGLEVIEAFWLFGLSKEKIDVVVHPQSIIHSMVEFKDGSIKAQLSSPDMKLPIQYALTYPERLEPQNKLLTKFPEIRNLTFFEPDYDKFECLKLAFDAMDEGGTAPCIMNAANEVAVSKFLNSEIGFLDIPKIIKKTLDKIQNHTLPDLETVFECDSRARAFAAGIR
ncbi:MAG TPA: 1-deoxy-D-xylulose-5-phosphate reductoisomerase [Ignavibacteriales bacterium]|nr:1-deoxy-D-xylulose-5-phosphate reductoisomerase [Ignavibacteriales bacterium]